jgi:regulatory protein
MKDIRKKAMDLLARREHARTELERKLLQRGFAKEQINKELDKLAAENLLSNIRFTESYINMRRSAGFGPIRIAEELRQRGIKADLIYTYLAESDTIWSQCAADVRHKRFGNTLPKTYNEHAKQAKFLNYRGFNQQQIDVALTVEFE